jgi:hypothetical protein
MTTFFKTALHKVFYCVLFVGLFLGFASYAQTTTTITATGTWTCPTGVTTVTVQCWGGGGGGGGASTNNPAAAGGGGGGGYATSVLAVTAGTTYNVTVGTGGTGLAGGSATQAINGLPSWFNTAGTIYADGGKGGWGSISGVAGTFGAGGTANIGTTTQNGGNGAAGLAGGAGYGGGGGAGADGTNAATANASGATGGSAGTNSGDAGGTGQGTNGIGGSASGGILYGGGGGGARRTTNTRTGGSGDNGAVAITYVCPTLNGTYTIGGGGSPSFATLTAAFTAITCGGLSGNINLVLQSGYTSAGETFPLTPSLNNGTYSVTIYPAVSGLSITSANASETMNFTGCSNYIIDGRVNQAGAMDLTIANTNTSGSTIQLINDASYNTFKYCDIQGINTTTTAGVIFFSTASSKGNNHNTIDHCSIHDGATTPYDCINSTGTPGKENDNNTISNCNIYNFFSATAVARGIDLQTGNTNWTITGNSLYQTATRTPTAASGLFPIYINNTGDSYVVTGNYVGGTAANCGGTALTFDAGATQDNNFRAINIPGSGVSSACTVQSNTITNIFLGVKSASLNVNRFVGISVVTGYVNLSNNIIGGATGTGSITISISTTSSQPAAATGILFDATQGSVTGNTVGAISLSGGAVAQGVSFRIIEADGALIADISIANNNFGGTTANSIQYAASAAPVGIIGLFCGFTNNFNANISGNIFQNITNSSTYTGGAGGASIDGIYFLTTSSALATITTNTFATLSVAAGVTGNIIAVYETSTTGGQTISNNVIHDLTNTGGGAVTTDVIGIQVAGGSATVSGNIIYNLGLSSTSTSASIYGVYVSNGTTAASNNMITLSTNTGYNIYGIYQTYNTAGSTYYFNSIYLSGTTASGSSSACYYSNGVNSARTVENNIFYNARSGGGVLHYAMYVSSKTGLTSNYNDLYSASDVGNVAGTSYITLANWQAAGASGQDANSVSGDPGFVAQAATPPNLHLTSTITSSVVISKGLSGTGITNDIDYDVRSTTPDMGADEYHTNYYSKSSGNLDVLANWGLNTDGTGANPASFSTSRDCSFNIRNNAAPTIGAAWAVTGSGNVIILGDGAAACNFTIPSGFSCTGNMNISNNGTLTNQNTTNPTFNVLNVGSTVNYNSANGVNQTVATVTYGNLILSNVTGAGSSTKTIGANISIAGNLTVSNSAVFDMGTFNANRIGGGGTLTIMSGGTMKFSGNSGGASASNNFPNNFSTIVLASAGTVEYYGATQTLYSSPTYGNITITTAGTKTAGANIIMLGGLTINTAATFDAGTFSHTMGGNFSNSGTFTYGTSTVNFNGSAAQTINGSTATTFYNLTINNTSGGVTLAKPTSIYGSGTTATSGTLTLTSGLLNTDAVNLLIMQNASTAPALTSASTSFVNGPMQYQKTGIGTTTLNFPVGATADCRPIALTVNHTNGTQYNYTAQLFNANPWTAFGSLYTDMPVTIDTISGVHYWKIDRVDNSTGLPSSSANLGYSAGVYPLIQLYFGANDQVYQGANLTIVKNTTATPATWIDIGGTSTLGNFSSGQPGSVTSTSSPSAFNSFSSFSLGSRNAGWDPLPIELLSFTAVPDGNKVDVKWETITETDNAYFTIEKSTDGKTFTKLIDVPGAGNSTSYKDYAETDYQPYVGTSYYRLKQTDKNGAYKYFNMVPVTFNTEGQQSITMFPNPILENTADLSVKVIGYKSQEVLVVLRDIQGKEFLSKVLLSEDENHVFVVDGAKLLPAGTYIVTASSNDKIYNYKLIVR